MGYMKITNKAGIRNCIEGKFGQGKRRFILGRVMAKLPHFCFFAPLRERNSYFDLLTLLLVLFILLLT